MSEDLQRLSNAATIAQAVYSFFVNPQTVETALQEPGRGDFTEIEATRAFESSVDPNVNGPQGFELLNHQPDDPTGFSATVFFDRSSNKYVLGIRGSEEFTDYVEDVSRIGSQGFAGDQLVSLYRYYKRLTTPAGQRVQYSDSEVSILQAIQLGIGTNVASQIFNVGRTATLRGLLAQDFGIVPTPGSGPSVLPPDAPLIVTGHSLGGHLALLFGRFFPDVTEHVYTYNAPGIGPQGELFLRAIGIQPSPSSLVTNVSAAMGTEAISKIPAKPGEIIAVATEPGDVFYQHNIVPLTDALALYGAFGTLSPGASLDAAAVSGIISAASPFPEDSLEVVLDHLGKLLDTGNAPTPITQTNADLAQRDAYYGNLYDVLDSREPGLDYQIGSLAGKTAVQITSLAAADVSVRYALNELMPFYAKNADYSSFDDSAFSGAWIASRSEMLEGMLSSNLVDRPFGSAGTEGSIVYRDVDAGVSFSLLDGLQYQAASLLNALPSSRQALLDYLDGATYTRSVVFGSNSAEDGDLLTGLAGGDRLFGGAGNDHLDGDSGDDYLDGGKGDDFLLGGAGADLLDGGEGSDRLEGGEGDDVYVFKSVLDADVILDRDGHILVDGSPLIGGRGSDGESYLSGDGLYTYAFSGDLDAGGMLTVNGVLRIEDFHNGDLGIQLGKTGDPGPEEPPAPPVGTLLQGDYDYQGYLDEVTHTQFFGFDEYGNPNADAIAVPNPDRVDSYEDFPGTPGSTHFVAGGGNDVMQDILGGDDWIELGAGDDFGWGGTGNDLVEGGAGRDIVAGGRGDDVLYANTRDSAAADLADDGVATSPTGGDLLSGGDGDDLIYGDAEANLIEGGTGDDRIFAGAGDDWIGADVSALAASERYRIFPPNNDWVNREVDILWNPFVALPQFQLGAAPSFGQPLQASINGHQISVVSSAADGADFIDAGAGNDNIFSGNGDDIIVAGGGDDYIDPGYGMDMVSAGAGRDYIVNWFGDTVGDDIDGGDGDDFIVDMPDGGNNRIDGGRGDDLIQSGSGSDILIGGDGNDSIYSFGGGDVVLAGSGDDEVWAGGGGNKFIAGGPGNDHMVAILGPDGGSATFLWRPGDGDDMGLVLAGAATLQIGDLGPGDVSVRYVTGVATGEFLVEGQPEAAGSGFEFAIGGGAETFLFLELPDFNAPADLSVRFADGTTWDDAYLRALAAAPGAPTDPIGIAGSDADDLVYGSAGGDLFAGSPGDDWLLGDAGDDVYLYAVGDGFDIIEDFDRTPGNTDVLRFADGIHAADIGVYATGADYVLIADAGGIRLRGGRSQEGAIERIEFSDGSFWSLGDLEARAEVLPDNRAPSLPSSFGSVSVDPGARVEVALPGDAISDPDRFDSVSLYVITAEGDKLPDWLHFDASSLSISGTPAETDIGVHGLLIIAADTNGAAAVGSLTIAVGAEIPVPIPEETLPPVLELPQIQAPAPASVLSPPPPSVREAAVSDAPVFRTDPAPLRRDDAFSELAAAPLPARESPGIGEAADPAFREIQHSMDGLLQTGRANLGDRYAEAIREFEERRVEREREDAPSPPLPTDEEVEAWNAVMHDWHDRNPGFAETELGGNDGTWSMGWGLPGQGEQALGGAVASSSLPGLANPIALARLPGAAFAPTLGEGFRDVR